VDAISQLLLPKATNSLLSYVHTAAPFQSLRYYASRVYIESNALISSLEAKYAHSGIGTQLCDPSIERMENGEPRGKRVVVSGFIRYSGGDFTVKRWPHVFGAGRTGKKGNTPGALTVAPEDRRSAVLLIKYFLGLFSTDNQC